MLDVIYCSTVCEIPLETQRAILREMPTVLHYTIMYYIELENTIIHDTSLDKTILYINQ